MIRKKLIERVSFSHRNSSFGSHIIGLSNPAWPEIVAQSIKVLSKKEKSGDFIFHENDLMYGPQKKILEYRTTDEMLML